MTLLTNVFDKTLIAVENQKDSNMTNYQVCHLGKYTKHFPILHLKIKLKIPLTF